jgi:hypothetical protein
MFEYNLTQTEIWLNKCLKLQIQCPTLNWITDNRINQCNLKMLVPLHRTIFETRRLIESSCYCYHFYACP